MNKKSPKSLAEQLRWQLIFSGAAFLLALLVLLFYLTWSSIEHFGASFMKMDAQALLNQLATNPDTPLPKEKSLQAYEHWNDIPLHFRQQFNATSIEANTVYDKVFINPEGHKEYLILRQHQDSLNRSIYILSTYNAALMDDAMGGVMANILGHSFLAVLAVFTLLFLLVIWLLKKTNEPLALLSHWAKQLKENEKASDVSFPIQELNTLASQLKEGVDKITQYNLREQQFLKHASHEMRTPLATIQACLDTLNLKLDGQNNKTIARALKASETMRNLSTALLWLARESNRRISKESISVSTTCQQLIKDHQYLCNDRELSIKLHVGCNNLIIEADLFLIVLTNLLRNAYQHSAEGSIILTIDHQQLEISNPIEHGIQNNSFPSYGLGLQLVQRICRKLNWQFSFVEIKDRITVTVLFPR